MRSIKEKISELPLLNAQHEGLYLELANVFINVKDREWDAFLATLPDEPSIGFYFKGILTELRAALERTADKYAEMHGLVLDINPDALETIEIELKQLKP